MTKKHTNFPAYKELDKVLNMMLSRFSFFFQKRLFIEPYLNPIDPVECDLVFHQLIEDIFEHRVPVSPQDAVRYSLLDIVKHFIIGQCIWE